MPISKIFLLALALIAARITYGLYNRKNIMWRWIVVYWCVLTVKNVIDLF